MSKLDFLSPDLSKSLNRVREICRGIPDYETFVRPAMASMTASIAVGAVVIGLPDTLRQILAAHTKPQTDEAGQNSLSLAVLLEVLDPDERSPKLTEDEVVAASRAIVVEGMKLLN